LLERGATVIPLARNVGAVEATVRADAIALADIADRDAVHDGLGQAAARGPLSGIVNCAGVVAFGSLAALPDDVVARLFAVNARGTINVLAGAATHLGSGGVVASFTGVAADMQILGMGAYCASKAAAKTAMAVGQRELRRQQISVLDIRAPHTETGLVHRALAGEVPAMPQGLEVDMVVRRVLDAIETGERDLPAEAFATR
jgi:cyclic-di-GMP-binding biofilm dispersal mediator protein